MPSIALDMDGTLFEWGADHLRVGAPMPGAFEAIRQFQAWGLDVIVHSCRATWEAGGGTNEVARAMIGLGFQVAEMSYELSPDGNQRPCLIVLTPDLIGMDVIPDYYERPVVFIWTGVGKPIASWYVDDRAVTFSPEIGGWAAVVERVRIDTA